MRQVGRVTAEDGSGDAAFRAAVADLRDGQEQVRAVRPELCFEDLPAPRKLAPFAAAVGVTARVDGTEAASGRFVLLYDPAGQRGWSGPLRVIVYIRAEVEPEIAEDPMVGQVAWSWLTEALDARTAGYAAPSGTVTRVITEGFGAKSGEPPALAFELRASWSPLTGPAGGSHPGTGRLIGTGNGTAGESGRAGNDGHTGSGAGNGDRAGPGTTGPGTTGAEDTAGPGTPGAGTAGPGGLDGHLAAWCGAVCAAAGLPPLAPGVTALRPAARRRSP